MNELLECVEIEPTTQARAAVIWLHGLGADGHDFEPIVPELGLDPALGVRFVFPHAPRIPVTLNGGMVMPAWYDITSMDLRRRHDAEGIARSVAAVEALIAREVERGIAPERIVLAGFSQGGAIALYAALTHPERLAGVVALSTYLVQTEALEAARHPANQGLPIFQAHGNSDPMVVFERGEGAHEQLVVWGHPVDWHVYGMVHQVCLEEIQALGRWLGERLA
ncbi:MAG: alpha/beta fold hydrolase [Planctomycetota bacterium]